jgi:hypothetical protein
MIILSKKTSGISEEVGIKAGEPFLLLELSKTILERCSARIDLRSTIQLTSK